MLVQLSILILISFNQHHSTWSDKFQTDFLIWDHINDKINIEISYASKTAIEKIEKNGGKITLTVK